MSERIEYSEWMSESDAVLWNVERDPLLRSTIVSVWTLDRPPDPARFAASVERSVALIPRLRQRVVPDLLGISPPRWEIDRNFGVRYHVRHVRVGGEGTLRDLLDLAAPIGMQAFDKDRPLWELHLVEGLRDGGAGVVMKLHHSVSDGLGLVRMTGSLVERGREPDPEQEAKRNARASAMEPLPAPRSELGHLRDAVAHRAEGAVERLGRLGRAFGRGAGQLARAPLSSAGQLRDQLGSLGRLLRPVSHPLSPLMTRRSLTSRFDALCVPLDELKRPARRVGGTLNDAFVAGVSGGLRLYHAHHGRPVDALRMNMPINVREGEKGRRAGNLFVPARFELPVGIADPLERLRAIHEVVQSQRREPALGMIDDVNALFVRLGPAIATSLAGAMMKALDLVTSNVPGPPSPVYVSGAKIERMVPFGPLAGAALNVTLFSYDGTLHLGLHTDAAAVPDPELLSDCLRKGLDEVRAIA